MSPRQTPAGSRPRTDGNRNPFAGGQGGVPHSARSRGLAAAPGGSPRPRAPERSPARVARPGPPRRGPGGRGDPRWSIWRRAQLPPLAAQGALDARAGRYHDATGRREPHVRPRCGGSMGGISPCPGEGVSVAAGAGPTASRGLPPGQADPGLLDGGRSRCPSLRVPGAVRAKAVILRCEGSRGPCGGSRADRPGRCRPGPRAAPSSSAASGLRRSEPAGGLPPGDATSGAAGVVGTANRPQPGPATWPPTDTASPGPGIVLGVWDTGADAYWP